MATRNEHPNPQFERANWQNLNGEWDFAYDFGKSGRARGLISGDGFDMKIYVPFCPESPLSGIGNKDFMPCVWYKRTVEISKEQLSGRVLLNIGACDYETEVYVNSRSVGKHIGGYSSFGFDITDALVEGENTIVICAEDDTRSPLQPVGKQCVSYHSCGCSYTRTTGIWQTVYLEFVPLNRIKSIKLLPNINTSSVTVEGELFGSATLTVTASYEGKAVGSISTEASSHFALTLPLSELHLWEVGKGRLYDLTLTFGEDTVKSYFGMRQVEMGKTEFLLNRKSVFMRLVLDQGFYPDGIYTAPSEEAIIKDIQISLDAGFNGARLHEKVFEPRFLYHCDRLGYIVWGEYPNWGFDYSDARVLGRFLPEWLEILERDFNHPSIVGWCPYNEVWTEDSKACRQALLKNAYLVTKAYDSTRPCIDTSGGYHVVTDIYDIHDYDQNPVTLKERLDRLPNEGIVVEAAHLKGHQSYGGEPVFVSEYGGIGIHIEKVDDGGKSAWSYGNACKSLEEFYERYRGLTDAILDNPHMCGFCYTQLYDIEQEQNGLYDYERRPKFDMAIIKAINERPAAIEGIEE